jgi:hypothetical protein
MICPYCGEFMLSERPHLHSKPSRGGKRPGAGRKPGTPMQKYQIRLSEEAHAKAVMLGRGNLSLGVRIAVFKAALP